MKTRILQISPNSNSAVVYADALVLTIVRTPEGFEILAEHDTADDGPEFTVKVSAEVGPEWKTVL